MRRIFLILVLVSALAPAAVYAEGLSVKAGFQTVSFGADLGEYYDIPPGPGAAAQVSLDFIIPLDIGIGLRTVKEGNSGEDLEYQWIEAGPRFIMGKEGSSVRPDIFLGVGSYDLKIGDFEFDTAAGGYFGFGIEEYASRHWSGRFQVKAVYWKSDTFNTDGASLNLSLLFGYTF